MNHWEARYQQGDTGWDRGEVSPALHTWLDSDTLQPCRILIPGCGRGYEVVALAQRGFDVTAVDIAPSAIRSLQQTLDEADYTATVHCGNLFDYHPPAPFDALYEQTCLCAIEPEQRSAYAAAIHRWLKPSGRLFALFMQTGAKGGPPFHCDIEAMRQLFTDKQWQWQWQQQQPFQVMRSSGKFELGTILTKR